MPGSTKACRTAWENIIAPQLDALVHAHVLSPLLKEITMSQLTHINAAGEARHMVVLPAKAETVREARAEAFVTMRSETLAMIAGMANTTRAMFSPPPELPVFRPPNAPRADPAGATRYR